MLFFYHVAKIKYMATNKNFPLVDEKWNFLWKIWIFDKWHGKFEFFYYFMRGFDFSRQINTILLQQFLRLGPAQCWRSYLTTIHATARSGPSGDSEVWWGWGDRGHENKIAQLDFYTFYKGPRRFPVKCPRICLKLCVLGRKLSEKYENFEKWYFN